VANSDDSGVCMVLGRVTESGEEPSKASSVLHARDHSSARPTPDDPRPASRADSHGWRPRAA